MSVKSELLSIFENNRGKTISGQELAVRLNVSRAAIWKAIHKLTDEGYQIMGVNKAGYTLMEETDVLSVAGIKPYLSPENSNSTIVVYNEIDSTNKECKKRAIDGAGEGTLIVSDLQTEGRGRMGRSFFSPKGSGIYMSILLKPKMSGNEALLITTAASVSVVRAIRALTKLPAQIKWVNDIYLNNKKICGILTEGMTDFETGGISSVILGIGINYKKPENGYPDEIKQRAGYLSETEKIPRNQLIAEIFNQFFEIYKELPNKDFMKDYRKWSLLQGEKIRYLEQDVWKNARVIDIDDEGGLVIEDEKEGKRVLRTGEVTVRKV